MSDEPKCVVCGCTQYNACDEGCEWVMANPMLCSACVSTYVLAALFDFFFAMEGKATAGARRKAAEIRNLYDQVGDGKNGLPKLRQLRAIARREEKLFARPAPTAVARRRASSARKGTAA